jgi:Tfp pilus assembly protein PilF
VEAATSATPSAPKKPTSPLEKKEMIASALRDGNEALKSEDSVKALELFESVVKQDKDQRDAWFRIGYLKEMSGDIQGAIKAFREVKRILAN